MRRLGTVVYLAGIAVAIASSDAGAAVDQKTKPEEKPAPKVKRARVLIVSSGNDILSAFFSDDAVKEVADVKWIKPGDLKDEKKYLGPAGRGQFELVVFDRCAPAKVEQLPSANTFFIGHPPPPWKLADLKRIEKPKVTAWSAKHALLRDVKDLKEIGIIDAFQLTDLPKGTERLIEGVKGSTFLVALPRKPHTDLVLTFELLDAKEKWNTDWPLMPSFPLFLRNVLLGLGNVEERSD